MNAIQFIQIVSDVLCVAIFVSVGSTAVRRRTKADIDIALLFGALAIVVVQTPLQSIFRIEPVELVRDVNASLAMALPYLLLRLLADFASVHNLCGQLS